MFFYLMSVSGFLIGTGISECLNSQYIHGSGSIVFGLIGIIVGLINLKKKEE